MLKKTFVLLVLIAAFLAGGSQVRGEDGAKQTKVTAYYFHGAARCFTCKNMEKYSREAIEANFKDALASGKLEFKVVDVEAGGNEHFVDDYKLYTKALILSQVKDGKEVRSKNLDKIWELAGNKQKFIDYVAGQIKEFMKDAR